MQVLDKIYQKNASYLGVTKSSCTAIGSFLDHLTLDLFFS